MFQVLRALNLSLMYETKTISSEKLKTVLKGLKDQFSQFQCNGVSSAAGEHTLMIIPSDLHISLQAKTMDQRLKAKQMESRSRKELIRTEETRL